MFALARLLRSKIKFRMVKHDDRSFAFCKLLKSVNILNSGFSLVCFRIHLSHSSPTITLQELAGKVARMKSLSGHKNDVHSYTQQVLVKKM